MEIQSIETKRLGPTQSYFKQLCREQNTLSVEQYVWYVEHFGTSTDVCVTDVRVMKTPVQNRIMESHRLSRHHS